MLEAVEECFKFFLCFNLHGFRSSEGLFHCCKVKFLGAGMSGSHQVTLIFLDLADLRYISSYLLGASDVRGIQDK